MYRKLFDFRFDFKNNKNVTNLNENTKYCYETIFRQIDILSSKNCTLRLLINIKKIIIIILCLFILCLKEPIS